MARRVSKRGETHRSLLALLCSLAIFGGELPRLSRTGELEAIAFPALALAADAFTVESVPNPRDHGGSLSDPSHFLAKDDRHFERKLSELEKRANIQLAVVILPSIGSADPKDFATKLFARFGVGDKKTDRGLLVLHVLDQKRVEIETGHGLEGALPDVKCAWILRDITIPAFKDGKFALGMQGTIAALAFGAAKEDASREELKKAAISDIPPAKAPALQGATAAEEEAPFLPTGLDLAPVGLLALLSALASRSHRKLFPDEEKRPVSGFGCGAMALLLLWGGAAAVAFFTSVPWFVHGASLLVGLYSLGMFREWIRTSSRARARFGARNCPTCGSKMTLVRGTIDHRFLERHQQLEQELGSFDYDVWNCSKGHKTIEQNEGHSPGEPCKACSHHTIKKTSRTLREATHLTDGQREEITECLFCQTKDVRLLTIPKMTAGSSGTSKKKGSRQSSRSSGSYGGGSSGGGGAGGSY